MSQQQLSALEASVVQMQNALIAAMDEVEAVRKDMLVENAKLQREFRDTVDVILQQSQELRSITRSAKAKQQRTTVVDDPSATSSSSVRRTSPFMHMAADTSPIAAALHSDDSQSIAARLTALETSMAALATTTTTAATSSSGHHVLAAGSPQPPSIDAHLAQARAMFIEMMAERDQAAAAEKERTSRRLDDLESRAKASQLDTQKRLDAYEAKIDSARSTINELRKEILELRSLQHQQQSSVSPPSRFGIDPEVQRAIRDATESTRRDLAVTIESSKRTTEQQVANIQEQCHTLAEATGQLDAETRELKLHANLIAESAAKAESLAQQVLRHHGEIQRDAEETRSMHKEATAGTSNAADRCAQVLREVQKFADEFTTEQAHVIRDEVLALVQTDTAVVQRRIDEKQRRDEAAMMRQDVMRAMTQVEGISDEMTRLLGQQHSLQQAFQRTEQVVSGLSFKIDTAMKDEFNRAEALQKSFFARQEALIREERHELAVNITADVQRMQAKHSEELSKIEQRRLDDMSLGQVQLREDFAAFVSSQRQSLDDALVAMKGEVSRATIAASEDLARGYTNAIDTNKRLQAAVVDDLRKAIAHISDEMRRVSSQNEENTKRLSEQHTFLHTRFQQLVEDELRRAERVTTDLQLRLNQQVDEEVKRTVTATEGTLRTNCAILDEKLSKNVKTLREEIAAVRTSLQSIVAPSSTMSAIDTRVDVLRRDVSDLHDIIGQMRSEDCRAASTIKNEIRPMIDSVRSEILRDVGSQLVRFDEALADAINEQARSSRALADVSQRVDSYSRVLSHSSSGVGSDGLLVPAVAPLTTSSSALRTSTNRTPPPPVHSVPAAAAPLGYEANLSSVGRSVTPTDGATPRPSPFHIPTRTAATQRGTAAASSRSADLLLLSSPRFDSDERLLEGRSVLFGAVARRGTPPPPPPSHADLLVGAFADAGSP